MLRASLSRSDAPHLCLHLVLPAFPESVFVYSSSNILFSQTHLFRDPWRSLLNFLLCSHRCSEVLQVPLRNLIQREMFELVMHQLNGGLWLYVGDEHLSPITDPERKPPIAEFQLSSFSLRFAEASFPNS